MSLQKHTFTLGVEEEYQIIDMQTLELSSSSRALLRTAQQSLGDAAQPELQLSQVEAATPVCQNVSEVRAALVNMRSKMIAAATEKKRYLAAAGTHPFSHWKSQRITPRDRYREIAEDFQQLAREPIFGCHVHIGMPDRETALQVMNRARLWLSPLLALSASSPYWQGDDTGYNSFRTVMWSRWPTSGQPQYFATLAEYDAVIQSLVAVGSIEDTTKVYWDIRLSERFGTIEFRVADCCLTVDEAVMIAGLVQAVVRTAYEQAQTEQELPIVYTELLRAAHWQAARYGLSGELIDVVEQRALPALELVEKTLTTLRPALEAEGTWEEIAGLVRETCQRGNGARRQKAIYRQNGQMEDVVKYIVAETGRGLV